MPNFKFGDEDDQGRVWNGFEFVSQTRLQEMHNNGMIAYIPEVNSDDFVDFPPQGNGPKVFPPLPQWKPTPRVEMMLHELLRIIEEVPDNETLREGLLETPERVAKAFRHWFGGYSMDPAKILKTFEDGAEKCDEMVMVKDIPIYSKCEHHMADIFGTVTIAYIPNGKIVGLSKLARLADGFARRLQVQERLTTQIADALNEHLKPKGVGVLIKARHMCMESRGICQQGHHTVTQALRGVMMDEPATRAEFLALAR